jgi:hypothetical protein
MAGSTDLVKGLQTGMTRFGALHAALLACFFGWMLRFADAVDDPWNPEDPFLSGD